MTRIKTLVASLVFVLALAASAATMAQKPQPGTHARESCCAMKDCCKKDASCCKDKDNSCCKGDSCCNGDSCPMKHDKKDKSTKS